MLTCQDVSEHPVKSPWHPGEIERAHEEPRVLALAAGPGPHEPAKLRPCCAGCLWKMRNDRISP
jgi:hypothetical protein